MNSTLARTGWLIAIALLLLVPLRASAHAAYDRSIPAAGEVMGVAPAQVEVWFTQELFRREGENALEVTGPDGSRVDQGDARIDDDDRKHMVVSLQPDLPPGEYTVSWRSLSAEDGDTDSGTFTFTIDPSAAGAEPPSGESEGAAASPTATEVPAATAAPAAAEQEEAGASSAALPCMPGLLGIVLVGMAAFSAERRRSGF